MSVGTYITSLEQLKAWCPGDKVPIVMEWYLDWMFDDVLPRKKYDDFKEAIDAMVTFTKYCEHMKDVDAFMLIMTNLKYWHSKASKNDRPFKKYLNRIIIEYLGYRL